MIISTLRDFPILVKFSNSIYRTFLTVGKFLGILFVFIVSWSLGFNVALN